MIFSHVDPYVIDSHIGIDESSLSQGVLRRATQANAC